MFITLPTFALKFSEHNVGLEEKSAQKILKKQRCLQNVGELDSTTKQVVEIFNCNKQNMFTQQFFYCLSLSIGLNPNFYLIL